MPRAAVTAAHPPSEPAHTPPKRSTFQIEPMTVSDIVEVAEMERTVFPDPWSPDSFLAEVERRPDVGWPVVVRDGRTIIAYAIVWFIVDEIHIGNIAVHPDRRGCGLGSWLLERILAEGKRRAMVFATLEVRPSNRAALALYERFGFRQVAVRRRYYRNNDEDAWVLAIALHPSAEGRLG